MCIITIPARLSDAGHCVVLFSSWQGSKVAWNVPVCPFKSERCGWESWPVRDVCWDLQSPALNGFDRHSLDLHGTFRILHSIPPNRLAAKDIEKLTKSPLSSFLTNVVGLSYVQTRNVAGRFSISSLLWQGKTILGKSNLIATCIKM